MSLEIIAAKDFNHAFEIVSMDPEKGWKITLYQNRKK